MALQLHTRPDQSCWLTPCAPRRRLRLPYSYHTGKTLRSLRRPYVRTVHIVLPTLTHLSNHSDAKSESESKQESEMGGVSVDSVFRIDTRIIYSSGFLPPILGFRNYSSLPCVDLNSTVHLCNQPCSRLEHTYVISRAPGSSKRKLFL